MSFAVLVVDDEDSVCRNLAAYLEDEDMQVTTTGTGEEAVALLRDGASFDACVMDMRLPGMDGNRAILALHELAPEMPFFVHTGSANYSLPPSLRQLGLDDNHVFTKPLRDMAVLAEALLGNAHFGRGKAP